MATTFKSIRLYVVEEQELFREVYRAALASRAPFELLDISVDEDLKKASHSIIKLSPDVLVLSFKRLTEDIVQELERIRRARPGTGVVLLLVFYGNQDTELLRQLAKNASQGAMALFLKQSLDITEHLCNLIMAVHQGQVILDPVLSSSLLMGKSESSFLKNLTARELEILSLLARGHSNAAIASVTCLDPKTVEHHINSMYNKLKTASDFSQKHPRVNAARLYLEAIGELATSTVRRYN